MRVYLFVIFSVSGLCAGELSPDLIEYLSKVGENEKVRVIVHMAEKPDFSQIRGLPYRIKAEYLRDFAKRTQLDVLEYVCRRCN